MNSMVIIDELEYASLMEDATKWRAAMREAEKMNVTDLDSAKGAILSLVQRLDAAETLVRSYQMGVR